MTKIRDDGPGFRRLTKDERFEQVRLETLRLQQQALDEASSRRANKR